MFINIYFSVGPLRWEQAFSKRFADLSLASNSSHRLKIFASSLRYLRCCILFSFFSDTKRIWMAVSIASLWRSLIRRYIGSWPRPEARWLRLWCHPSMLFLVRMACLNTVQSAGLQVVPWILVLASNGKHIHAVSHSGTLLLGQPRSLFRNLTGSASLLGWREGSPGPFSVLCSSRLSFALTSVRTGAAPAWRGHPSWQRHWLSSTVWMDGGKAWTWRWCTKTLHWRETLTVVWWRTSGASDSGLWHLLAGTRAGWTLQQVQVQGIFWSKFLAASVGCSGYVLRPR